MPSPSHQKSLKFRQQAFEDAEASLRLEGLDPASHPRYQEVKTRLLAGEISFDQAEAALKAQDQSSAPPVATLATFA
jgi:hypothetical protein